MKQVSVALDTSLRQSHSLSAIPRLIAEWNMNRYFPVIADNTPTEDSSGFDIEMFPIESVYRPNRPTKGINKARIGEGLVSAGNRGDDSVRFYVGDYDDVYKYWTSPDPSDSGGNISNCNPYIVYGTKGTSGIDYQQVSTNKIVVTFENSWATPVNFTINGRVDGAWTTLFTQSNITDTSWVNDGRLVIYYNGTTWRQNNPAASTAVLTTLSGVSVSVTLMGAGRQKDGSITSYSLPADPYTFINTDGTDSHCNVIEISACLEADLSDDLVSVDDTFDLGESSNIYPIGTLTGNVGNVSLWNGEGKYNNDNVVDVGGQSSPFINLLEPNVKFTLDYVYDLGNTTESVRQFTLYAESWDGQRDDEVAVPLMDYSKFFQETTPRPAMWENLTVPQIIYRVCDSVGFNNYLADENDAVTNFVIPVFWTDGQKNLWEVLDELAKASQTAIFFDHNNVLRIKTRDSALNDTKAPDYNLLGEYLAPDLANIASTSQDTTYEANSIKVSYQKTRWSDYNNGIPALQKVWEPEGTVALRSTQLLSSMPYGASMFYINALDVRYWPYAGLVNIEGEIMRYEGLEYAYYTYVGTVGTRNVAVVKSSDEVTLLNEKTPAQYQYRNALTGGIKVIERGAWNSIERDHFVDAAGYTVRRLTTPLGRQYTTIGFAHLPASSKLQMNANLGYRKETDMMIATVGAPTDTPFWFYGTRFRFITQSGMVHQHAGLALHNDGTAQENGYYIELTPTSKITGAMRKTKNELMIYTRRGGVNYPLGAGAVVAVGENIDYQMDVSLRVVGTTHYIKVWINGKNYLNVTAGGANARSANGRFGMYIRGRSAAQYEYLYALVREEPDPPDDFSFLDKSTGAFVGDLWEREWVYRWNTVTRIVNKRSTQVTYRMNEKYFDEFGPYVHEIREYDVSFEPNPVLHSRPYMTNDWCAAILEYTGTPFGAKFVVANVARINAIINGEDTLTFPGAESSVEQVFTVFGRPLVIDEAEEKTFKNDLQIQRRGEITSELSSPWIQSEEMATALGEWILKNMSYGSDILEVELFGNPTLEVTDVVRVFYEQKDLRGDKYFIIAVNTEWDNGISTKLTLRRANPAVV